MFYVSEGLWGLTHPQVSDIDFGEAEWTQPGVENFETYGERFLHIAAASSVSPLASKWRTKLEAFNANSHAADQQQQQQQQQHPEL